MLFRHVNFQGLATLENLVALCAGVLEGVGKVPGLDVVADLVAARVREGVADAAMEPPLTYKQCCGSRSKSGSLAT
jgi:hypothetical protein